MDRIPLEVYRVIVSMIDDAVVLYVPGKDGSPSATADAEQWVSNVENESHVGSSGRHSSSILESTRRMQRRLQDRLLTFRKTELVPLMRKLRVYVPAYGKRQDREWEPGKVVTRLATLKALRLCNRKLAAMTVEFLFEKVLLRFTEESHAKLESISQHTYGKHVRVLQIMPKAISGPLLPKKEFGRWLRGKRTLIDNPLMTYAHPSSVGHYMGPLFENCLKMSRRAINLHYKEYSSLHNKQQKLLITGESVMGAAIVRLPRLKRIESGLQWDRAHRGQDLLQRELEAKTRIIWKFLSMETSPSDRTVDKVWKASACQTNFDTDQGTMVLRAVARGRAISGAPIDVGPLFQDLSKTVMQIADPQEKAAVNALMADTKTFVFYLKLADLDDSQDLLSSGTIVSFLQTMTNLERLVFRSAYLGEEDRLDQAFGPSITWPHLAHLSVACADTFDFDGLAALIHRHRASLRRVKLFFVRYDDWNWCNLIAETRAGALERIRVWKLGPEVVPPHRLPYPTWQNESYEWAVSGSLCVFSRGGWSPRCGLELWEELVARLFPSFKLTQVGSPAVGDEFIEEAGSEA